MDFLDVYDFTNPIRGIAVIINNENFQHLETEIHGDTSTPKEDARHGSSIDAANLESAFRNLGFTVWRYDNLKATEMVKTLEMVSANRSVHDRADCFVCAVLTHGCNFYLPVGDNSHGCEQYCDCLFGTDNDVVPVYLLTNCFRDDLCPGLIGKPKLFFIQACRGGEMDEGVDVTVASTVRQGGGKLSSKDAYPTVKEELTQTDPPVLLYPPPIYKDFLLMYATPPGYTAWRSIHTGSWFIQDLCSLLTPENTCRMSLTTLLTRVSQHVSLNHRSISTDEKQDGKKQVPCLISMLTRDVFFLSDKLPPVSDL